MIFPISIMMVWFWKVYHWCLFECLFVLILLIYPSGGRDQNWSQPPHEVPSLGSTALAKWFSFPVHVQPLIQNLNRLPFKATKKSLSITPCHLVTCESPFLFVRRGRLPVVTNNPKMWKITERIGRFWSSPPGCSWFLWASIGLKQRQEKIPRFIPYGVASTFYLFGFSFAWSLAC